MELSMVRIASSPDRQYFFPDYQYLLRSPCHTPTTYVEIAVMTVHTLMDKPALRIAPERCREVEGRDAW